MLLGIFIVVDMVKSDYAFGGGRYVCEWGGGQMGSTENLGIHVYTEKCIYCVVKLSVELIQYSVNTRRTKIQPHDHIDEVGACDPVRLS